MPQAKKKAAKKSKSKVIRTDFKDNHSIIREAYIKLTKKKRGKRPSVKEVSDYTELSTATINNHLKTLDFNVTKKELRVYSDEMAMAVRKAGLSGNARSQRFWFELVEDWAPRKEPDSGEGEIVKPDQIIAYDQETTDLIKKMQDRRKALDNEQDNKNNQNI